MFTESVELQMRNAASAISSYFVKRRFSAYFIRTIKPSFDRYVDR